MAVTKIFAKDMKMFFRDIRSFILLFLTPVVVVFIVGSSFIGTTPSNINVAICSIGNNDIGNYIQSTIDSTKVFSIININGSTVEECRASIGSAIAGSTVRAGLIVPEETKFSTTRVELIVDNSKMVGDYLKSYFKLATNDLSQKIAKGYVDVIFNDVDEAKKKLDDAEQKMTEGRSRLVDIQNQLSSVRRNLEAVSSSISSVKNDVNAAITSVNSSYDSIDSARREISDAMTRLDRLSQSLWQLNISQSDRSSILGDLSNLGSYLQNANSLLGISATRISQSRSNLNDAVRYLDNINIDSTINLVDSSLDYINKSIEDADTLLDMFIKMKNSMQSSDIQKPESTQFVDVSVKDFFGSSRFIDFLFPSTLMMVIMIISLFLASITFMRQRSAGIIQRISITPHGIRTVLISRLAQIVVLNTITVPILIVFGLLVFNITLTWPIVAALFFSAAMTSVIFASIGLIIASFSRYESTAILLSIFITLPMIFLSGILLPVERLPEYLALIANALPLNISIKIFEGIMFYSVSYAYILLLSSYLLVYFAVSVIIARLLIKPGTC